MSHGCIKNILITNTFPIRQYLIGGQVCVQAANILNEIKIQITKKEEEEESRIRMKTGIEFTWDRLNGSDYTK